VECKAHSVLSSGEELDVGRNDKVKSLMSMCRFRRFCEKDASLTTCIRFLARKQPFSSESCLIPVERVDGKRYITLLRSLVVVKLWLPAPVKRDLFATQRVRVPLHTCIPRLC
jgi:hypothetical protein